MDRGSVEQWVDRYERSWRTAGTDHLHELFAPDANYLASPWAKPLHGLEEITGFWESERDGADEEFTMATDVVAVDGLVAVVRVSVEYAAPHQSRWRDLWVLELTTDGRCASFEEWPFAPDQEDGH